MLPETLKANVEREAKREGISLGKLVRAALEKYLSIKGDPYRHDPFFSKQTLLDDEGPADVSIHHDDYLYKGDIHR